jgi:tetratricopeptide (TPR) repeat protein
MLDCMNTSVYISSEEADRLFIECRALTSRAVIVRLQFVSNWLKKEKKEPLFEYDTDLNHACYLLGLAHEKLGDTHSASAFYLSAIQVWPEDADAYVAFSNNETDASKQIPILERGLQKFEDSRVRFNLAHAYMDLGQYEDAKSHLGKIDPSWSNYKQVEEELQNLSTI